MDTVDQFATKIKTKYPAYQSMGNSDLVNKIITKYPQYKTQVDFGQQNTPAAPTKSPGFLGNIDQAINKPAYDLSKETSPVKGALKGAANFGKDLFANIYGMAKAPVVAAKNVAWDIPRVIFGAGTSGTKFGPGTKPGVAEKEKAAAGNQFDTTMPGALVKNLPDLFLGGAAKTILPPFVQNLAGVGNNKNGLASDSVGRPEPTKAVQSLAEKPVSNILPYVLSATGIQEMRGANNGGGLTTGSAAVDSVVSKVGKSGEEAVKAPFKAVKQTAQAISDRYEGTGINKTPEQLRAASDKSLITGVQKGIKPTILGKQTVARQAKFYDNARSAVQTIAENRGQIKIVDPQTGEITSQPKTVGDFAQAIDQGKQLIYKKYSDMSRAAGAAGAQADVTTVIGKLYKTAFEKVMVKPDGTFDVSGSGPNVKYGPEVRQAALNMIKEVQELQGASPEVMENRIKELNASLTGYYEGRTAKAQAQIEASTASLLREELDKNIGQSLDKPGYQELKNKYGSLKALEKDVNKRAIVLARQNVKSLPQTLTDIWSGAELVSGLFGNPAAFARGAASKGIMSIIAKMNAPDTYISKMFDDAYKAYPERTASGDVVPPAPKPAPTPFPKLTPPNLPMGLSIKDVSGRFDPASTPESLLPKGQGEIPKTTPKFEGFTDLSTKIIDKLQGRDTVSKQFISDLTNSGDVRQGERNVIRQVLDDYPEGSKISATEFANKVKTELLPLKREYALKGEPSGTRYENIALPDNLRGKVANYSEHIYESPIETSGSSVHFRAGGSKNYFAHTRVEDMAPADAKFVTSGGYAQTGTLRRVIELQSDLFQKGRLEDEAQKIGLKVAAAADKQKLLTEYFKPGREVGSYGGGKDKVVGFDWNDGNWSVKVQGLKRDGTLENWVRDHSTFPNSQELAKFVANHKDTFSSEWQSVDKGLKQLEPYSNTWHERIIREEVKQAALDGKTKLQFPTGETAMKIEGLGGENQSWTFADRTQSLTETRLKVGMEVNQGAGLDAWVITDVLGDGKFKAVPKDMDVMEKLKEMYSDLGKPIPKGQELQDLIKSETEDAAETFDISGKVDTTNPIYKFYEKEVGRFLQNQYGAKIITDPKGVKWQEVDIKPEEKNKPVKAFGLNNLIPSKKQYA